jgi:hypothetical protein
VGGVKTPEFFDAIKKELEALTIEVFARRR